MFEGDDYIGPSANHASRLCEAAAPGEVLALGAARTCPTGSTWRTRHGARPGDRDLDGVVKLTVADSLFAHRAVN